ncbi:MAG: hypothetical protein KAY54_03195 [Burkholderiaceae bacterium]|nr:hypothetical protein [Burkholderiaceae bacterium]
MAEGAVSILRAMRRRLGPLGMIEALMYPLLTPIYAALAWWRSLPAARVLLADPPSRYRGFHPVNALTSYFYATQWLNIARFGRQGISPHVGLGHYPLSRWFHLTLVSSCLYAQAGAACTLGGTLAWLAFHAVWLGQAAPGWTALVLLTLASSSAALAMAFTRQNYNILGWLWLPLALYAVHRGLWPLAALLWLVASFASVTAVVAAVPLMLAQALLSGQAAPVLCLVPALLKLGSHFALRSGAAGPTGSIGVMGRIIGVVSKGARYRRTSMRLRPFSAYFIVLYSTACAAIAWDQGLPALPLTALALFVINQLWVRFADEQSMILLFISVLAAHVLAAPPSITAWLALLWAANPMPVFLGLANYRVGASVVRIEPLRPFDHAPLEQAVEAMVAPAPAGSRILFAFADPGGIYEKVFDGYRVLLEVPLHVCARRSVHLFPDWHAVAETNQIGALDFWGRAPGRVLQHARALGADYVFAYTRPDEVLDDAWAGLGFTLMSSFDWADWARDLERHAVWPASGPPCWYLLRVPPLAGAVEA